MQTTSNTIWESVDGRRIALHDLDDTHLANIIRWVTARSVQYPTDLLRVLTNVAAERGLTWEFLNRAPIPYRDRNDQHWVVDGRIVG